MRIQAGFAFDKLKKQILGFDDISRRRNERLKMLRIQPHMSVDLIKIAGPYDQLSKRQSEVFRIGYLRVLCTLCVGIMIRA